MISTLLHQTLFEKGKPVSIGKRRRSYFETVATEESSSEPTMATETTRPKRQTKVPSKYKDDSELEISDKDIASTEDDEDVPLVKRRRRSSSGKKRQSQKAKKETSESELEQVELESSDEYEPEPEPSDDDFDDHGDDSDDDDYVPEEVVKKPEVKAKKRKSVTKSPVPQVPKAPAEFDPDDLESDLSLIKPIQVKPQTPQKSQSIDSDDEFEPPQVAIRDNTNPKVEYDNTDESDDSDIELLDEKPYSKPRKFKRPIKGRKK